MYDMILYSNVVEFSNNNLLKVCLIRLLESKRWKSWMQVCNYLLLLINIQPLNN